VRFPFLGIGVLFAIDGLGGGYYGNRAWQLFMKYLDPLQFGQCILVEGDTAPNEFCIGIYGLSLEPEKIHEVFENVDDPGLVPAERRFLEKLALDEQPLVIRGEIDGIGRLVTEQWSRIDHDLCKVAGWGYSPRQTPRDLKPSLRAELEQLICPRFKSKEGKYSTGDFAVREQDVSSATQKKWWEFWK
jgi:hypothetical protein